MNWISWLSPGLNLKRWLLLFSGGVLCCAFSLALLFNDQTMGFVEEMLFPGEFEPYDGPSELTTMAS